MSASNIEVEVGSAAPARERIEVPSVIDLTVGMATRELRRAGLAWKLQGAKKGIVVRQTPKAGKLVPQGTVVTLSVRSGPLL